MCKKICYNSIVIIYRKGVFRLTFDYAAVGKRIQHYRLAIGKTQEELAELASLSPNYLSNLETGKSAGSLDKYYSIAQVLGVTVDMLIDNTSNRASTNDYLFSNQLFPLISSLSLNQRKMLLDFVDLLNGYSVDKLSK